MINPDDFELELIEDLIDEANQDSDAASFYHLGTAKNSYGAIIIVKGGTEAQKAFNLLANHEMITPGKPVIDPPGFKKRKAE